MRPLALVTGASAGIGREFAEQLAARGYDLVLVARDQARLTALAERLRERGASSEVLTADLARDADVDRVVGRIRELPRLDLLVNNAGFGTRGTLAETAPGPQETMIRVHVLATMRLTQAALPGMVARGAGGIVNVASIAAFIASPRNVNYCATKAYVTVLTEGMAAELRGTGVRAQALCPGFTRTEFHARIGGAVERHPEFAWLSTRSVVAYSLRCLGRGGPVVCIPGLGYRVLMGGLRLVPRRLIGWVTRHRYDRL